MSGDRYMQGIQLVLTSILVFCVCLVVLLTIFATRGLVFIPFIVVLGGGWLVAKFFVKEDRYGSY